MKQKEQSCAEYLSQLKLNSSPALITTAYDFTTTPQQQKKQYHHQHNTQAATPQRAPFGNSTATKHLVQQVHSEQSSKHTDVVIVKNQPLCSSPVELPQWQFTGAAPQWQTWSVLVK